VPIESECHEQRPDRRTGFIERRIERVHPPCAELTSRVRQHGLDGRLSNRTSGALRENEQAGDLPVAGERHCGNGEQVDRESEEGDGPVSSRSVGRPTGDRTQAVAEKLARASDDADRGRARAEAPEELTIDARAALVGRVTEEVHDAHREHERERGGRAGSRYSQFRTRIGRIPRYVRRCHDSEAFIGVQYTCFG